MAMGFQVPETTTRVDSALLRIPELMGELVATFIRVPLLAMELAFSIVAIPCVLAQVLAGVLVHTTERLDGFVNGAARTRGSNHGGGSFGSSKPYRMSEPPEAWRPQPPAEPQRREPVGGGMRPAA